MPTKRHFSSSLVSMAAAVLAILFLFACQQSQQTAAPATTQPAPAVAEKVFVVFEGPWALVADPKDANSVLALAPKTKSHRDLSVSASNGLAAGNVLNFRSRPMVLGSWSALDPSFAQAKIGAQSLQHALDDKSALMSFDCPSPRRTELPGGTQPRRSELSSRCFDGAELRDRGVTSLHCEQSERIFAGRHSNPHLQPIPSPIGVAHDSFCHRARSIRRS